MSFPAVAGHNPVFGRDPGPPPPFAPPSGAAATPADVGPPPPGTTRTLPPGYYPVPGVSDMACCFPPFWPAPPPPYAPAAPPPPPGPSYGSAYGFDVNGHPFYYISGLNGSGRFPQPAPPVDPDFPAANLLNSTGGAGAEPGYNYFFPTRHAKVVVLKCRVPPWTLVPGTYGSIPFHASLVPASVTMAELLVGFGATNPEKGKNKFWEVYPQGGGAWGWKEHCTGDDAVMMARTVRDMGWVEERDGVLPMVYLWISKS